MDVTTALDGLRPMGGGLHACDPTGMLLVHPTADIVTARAVDVVFRPVGGSAAHEVRLAA